METLGKICTIVMPIAFVIFVISVLWVCRKPKGYRSCPHCGGDLVNNQYGSQCPSCLTIYEDRNNDPMNIS